MIVLLWWRSSRPRQMETFGLEMVDCGPVEEVEDEVVGEVGEVLF